MDIYVLIEKEYLSSTWCENIISGLNAEKKRKKVKLQFIDALDDITKPSEFTSVILIGSKNNWIEKKIYEVKKLGLNPILINKGKALTSYTSCNVVSSDILGAVTEAFGLCNNNSKKRVALYGVNPESVTDYIRKNGFLTVGGDKKDIYYNNGLLKGCFYSFLPNLQKYLAIICVNDFAAVSLINRLNKEGLSTENLSIISLSSSVLGRSFSPKITSFSINHEKFGAAAIMIHETIAKNKFVSSLNALIKYDLIQGETTNKILSNKTFTLKFSENPRKDINIYNDCELLEMMAVEHFLKTADDLDFKILKLTKENKKREYISDTTFLSNTALKYRMKNYCNNFKVDNIADVIQIIEKYITL